MAGRPPKLSTQQWIEIRSKYEGGQTISQLAREYKIDRKLIYRKIETEGWVQDPSAEIERRTNVHITGLAGTDGKRPTGLDPKIRDQVIEEEAQRRAQILRRHREEWEMVETLMAEAFGQRVVKVKDENGVEQKKPGSFEFFKQAKITAEALAIKQKGERAAWGIPEVAEKTKIEHSGPGGGDITVRTMQTLSAEELDEATPEQLAKMFLDRIKPPGL